MDNESHDGNAGKWQVVRRRTSSPQVLKQLAAVSLRKTGRRPEPDPGMLAIMVGVLFESLRRQIGS